MPTADQSKMVHTLSKAPMPRNKFGPPSRLTRRSSRGRGAFRRTLRARRGRGAGAASFRWNEGWGCGVTRAVVAVREVSPDDLPVVLHMLAKQREHASRIERAAATVPPEEIEGRLRLITADPGVRALVASVGADIVGMAILAAAPASPLCDQLAVQIHYLYVREHRRRSGAGKALLAAAAAFADELGAEQVSASVAPQLRDTNRFFARLGFAPIAVRRSVPVVVLRRQLVSSGVPGTADHVLARRRSLRRLRTAVHVPDLAGRATR